MKTIGIWVACMVILSSHCASSSEKPKTTIPSEISLFVDLAQRRSIHRAYIQASNVFNSYYGLMCICDIEPAQCKCRNPHLSRAVVQDYLLLENIGAQRLNKEPSIALLANILQEKVQEKMNLNEAIPCDFTEKAAYWMQFHTQARSFLAQELEEAVSLKQTDAETMIANAKQSCSISLLETPPFQKPRFVAALVVIARLLEYNYRIDTDWFCCTEAGIDNTNYVWGENLETLSTI
jgi:hypothetical protein